MQERKILRDCDGGKVEIRYQSKQACWADYTECGWKNRRKLLKASASVRTCRLFNSKSQLALSSTYNLIFSRNHPDEKLISISDAEISKLITLARINNSNHTKLCLSRFPSQSKKKVKSLRIFISESEKFRETSSRIAAKWNFPHHTSPLQKILFYILIFYEKHAR